MEIYSVYGPIKSDIPPPIVEDHDDLEKYLIAFSGGGAKGLVHIGAFHHLKDTNKGIASVAGTSAGAIIAALISVGYKPDELLTKNGDSPLWDDVKINFKDLNYLSDVLENDKFNHLTLLYNYFRNREWLSLILNIYGKKETKTFFLKSASIFFVFIVALLLLSQSNVFGASALSMILAALAGVSATLIISFNYLKNVLKKANFGVENGICNLSKVEEIIEFALRRKIIGRVNSGPVCFGELTDIPLKIVATNISDGEPALFSTESTPGASVSKAVAASICLPYVFPAQKIEGKYHYDGGIVSNLPAWVFEEEKLIAPNLRAIAFNVQEVIESDKAKAETGIIENLFLSLLSAHQSIGLRSLVDLQEVVLKTDFNLLKFRFSRTEAARIVKQGQAGSAIIEDLYTSVPDLYCSLADQIRKKIAADITALLRLHNAPLEKLSAKRLRVAFAVQDPKRPGLMWIKFSSGFRNSKDKGIMIPVKTSTAGLAFSSEKVILTLMGKSTTGILNGPTDSYVRGIIDQKIKWIAGVPIKVKELNKDGVSTTVRKIVLTVDSFDDIFTDIPLAFSSGKEKEWDRILRREIRKTIESVLNSHIRSNKNPKEKPSIEKLFPRLEYAASKHI